MQSVGYPFIYECYPEDSDEWKKKISDGYNFPIDVRFGKSGRLPKGQNLSTIYTPHAHSTQPIQNTFASINYQSTAINVYSQRASKITMKMQTKMSSIEKTKWEKSKIFSYAP